MTAPTHPQPLTEEQLQTIRSETDRASRSVLRRYAKGALAAFLVLLASNVFVWSDGNRDTTNSRKAIVSSGRFLAVEACNRDYRATERLRGLFQRLQDAVQEQIDRGEVTQAKAQFAIDFYRSELSKIPLPDCREAQELITDDPADLRKPVTPLYPTG